MVLQAQEARPDRYHLEGLLDRYHLEGLLGQSCQPDLPGLEGL